MTLTPRDNLGVADLAVAVVTGLSKWVLKTLVFSFLNYKSPNFKFLIPKFNKTEFYFSFFLIT